MQRLWFLKDALAFSWSFLQHIKDIFIFQWWQTTLANNHSLFRESQVDHSNLFLAWEYAVHFENKQVMELERGCDNLMHMRNINSQNPYQMSSWSLVPGYEFFQILWLLKCLKLHRTGSLDRVLVSGSPASFSTDTPFTDSGFTYTFTQQFHPHLVFSLIRAGNIRPGCQVDPLPEWSFCLSLRCFLRIQGAILWHFKTK